MKYQIIKDPVTGGIRVQGKAEEVAVKPVVQRQVMPAAPSMVLELPLAIPTLPYYNSMQSIARLQGNMEEYDEDELPSEYCYNIVFVVGCGGTGGYVVRDLARYMSTLPYASRIIMVLMDGDEVEERNLIRQNFINKDIGKNKAEVLASRYGSAYGIKMMAIPSHLTAENFGKILGLEGLNKIIDVENGLQVSEDKPAQRSPFVYTNLAIISCVDNNKTRALISKELGLDSRSGLKNFKEICTNKRPARYESDTVTNVMVESLTWIDSGNESTAGQVICYYDTLFNELVINRGDHRNWVWDSGALRFGGNAGPKPGISTNSSSTYQFKNKAQYVSHPGYGFADYEANFKGQGRKNEQTVMKLIRSFNPYAPNADNQAKFILGSVLSSGNTLAFGYFTFPITWVYPDVLDQANDKTNLEMSCAERATIDTQNQIINVQAASHILYYASKVFASNPKNAFLDSYGCSWSGSTCVDHKLTRTNISRILAESNVRKFYPAGSF